MSMSFTITSCDGRPFYAINAEREREMRDGEMNGKRQEEPKKERECMMRMERMKERRKKR